MKLLFTCLLSISFCTISYSQATDKEINALVNKWHEAAAKANGEVFFGLMSKNSIYIGTDATERWNKDEFYKFAKPYFDRGTAWNFKPYDRLIQYSSDGNTIWFSELLETWMGICRGSGILIKENDSWKIAQYHLSVTVPNEIIQSFIDLVNKNYQNENTEKGN